MTSIPQPRPTIRSIIGYLLQIVRELKDGAGDETLALQQRTARLIASLKSETLRRLIEMGGNVSQRHAFVRDAAQCMAADAVLDLLKAAGEASGQTISHGLLRLLSKLAAHAEFGAPDVRPAADGALREQIGRLVDKWRLEDPTPGDYREALQHLATKAAPVEDIHSVDAHLPDAMRLVQLCLECGEAGPFIEQAIDRVVDEGRLGELLGLVATESGTLSPAAEPLLARLRRPEAIRLLLQQSPVDFDAVVRLQPFMDVEHYGVLLDALAAADDRPTRRKLLDCLAHATIDLGPLIVARLGDERWFVDRNLLVLLERRGRLPEGFSPARWTLHPDVRVRREAIRLQLRVPSERYRAVRAALEDKHPRLVHSGLAAIQQECPGELVDLVAAVALDRAVSDELRVLAVQALGRCSDRRALPVLLQLADGGRTLLGRQRLNAQSPVALAALEALAAGWSSDDHAARPASRGRRGGGPAAPARSAWRRMSSDPIRFLGALAQAFSVMTLYPTGHPSREGAVDDAYQELDALAAGSTNLAFTFLEDQVIFDKESLRGLKAWEWGPRLIRAGIQRLELQRRVSRDEFDSCLEEILGTTDAGGGGHERVAADAYARHPIRSRRPPERRCVAADRDSVHDPRADAWRGSGDAPMAAAPGAGRCAGPAG